MKKALLFIFAAASMFLLTFYGFLGGWFQARVFDSLKDVGAQMDSMDTDFRMRSKLGGGYTISKNVTSYFQKKNIQNALLLMPPQAYLKANNSNINLPEPIVFYYYTGYKSIDCNNPDAKNANFALIIKNGKFMLIPIKSDEMRNQIIMYYNKFKS